jgi:hypothetical protein
MVDSEDSSLATNRKIKKEGGLSEIDGKDTRTIMGIRPTRCVAVQSSSHLENLPRLCMIDKVSRINTLVMSV